MDRTSVQDNAAGIGPGDSAQHVYERSLSGAVGTDKPVNSPWRNGKGDARKRAYSSERTGNVIDLEQHGLSLPRQRVFGAHLRLIGPGPS